MLLANKITAARLADMLIRGDDFPVVFRIVKNSGARIHVLRDENTAIDHQRRRASANGDIRYVRIRIGRDVANGVLMKAGRLAAKLTSHDPVNIVLEDGTTFLLGDDAKVEIENSIRGLVLVVTATDTKDG